jgi:hypothetical protein
MPDLKKGEKLADFGENRRMKSEDLDFWPFAERLSAAKRTIKWTAGAC